MSSLAGRVYPTFFKYFDKETKSIRIKSRPAMIVHVSENPHDTEILVLPVSTLKNKEYYDASYDIRIDPEKLPGTSFSEICYIRTHKRTVIYKADIDFTRCIADIRKDYPALYQQILERMHAFDNYVYESERT